MKATGIIRKIDDLGRVVIPKEIRRTMRIREGDPLEIFTDKDGELIFKKYSPIGELNEFSSQICDSLKKSIKGTAAICDRDSLISVSGPGKKELLDKSISPQLNKLMDGRSSYCCKKGESGLPVIAGENKYSISAASPIISQGDIMGCVIIAGSGDCPEGTETELKLAETLSLFLGRQLED